MARSGDKKVREENVGANVEAPVSGDENSQIVVPDKPLKDAIIDEEVAREKLEEAIEAEKPKKKKRSLIINLIFLAINITVLGIIIGTFFKDTNGLSVRDIVTSQGNKLWWLLLGVGLFFVSFLADALIFYVLVKKSTGQKRFGTSYKVSAVGKYFDAITPMSVGGQPSQILNLTRAGISPGIASSIPIIRLIIYKFVYTFVTLMFLIFGVPFLPSSSSFLNLMFTFFKILAYLGLIVTFITSVMFVLIGSGKIVGRSLVRWLVRTGYKLRIVKDYRKSYHKVLNTVLEYQTSIKYLRKNLGMLIVCILLGLVEVVAYFAIPFAVVMALTPSTVVGAEATFSLLLICITKFIVCQMASVIIPLPGGTGMMEFSFMFLFSGELLLGVEQPAVLLGLLVWRFLTYYFTIVQGFLISAGDSIYRMSKGKKKQEKPKIAETQGSN